MDRRSLGSSAGAKCHLGFGSLDCRNKWLDLGERRLECRPGPTIIRNAAATPRAGSYRG